MGGPIHWASSRASVAAGYQIIARSACVLAPRQSYGSTGIKSRVVTPTLKIPSARARTTDARRISNSARNLILRPLWLILTRAATDNEATRPERRGVACMPEIEGTADVNLRQKVPVRRQPFTRSRHGPVSLFVSHPHDTPEISLAGKDDAWSRSGLNEEFVVLDPVVAPLFSPIPLF